MPIRFAQPADLQQIVEIYNSAIPCRLATADTEPVTVTEREKWFSEFDPARRPLWVLTDATARAIRGWLSLHSPPGQ